MRIFLDANILFSAAKTDGAIRQLLGLLRDARHELVADAYVVEEARRNLSAKAPHALETLAGILKNVRVQPFHPSETIGEALRAVPEKDRAVLAGAMRHHCDVLVTGDRMHFGAFYGKRVGGVAVHSPRSLAELVLR